MCVCVVWTKHSDEQRKHQATGHNGYWTQRLPRHFGTATRQLSKQLQVERGLRIISSPHEQHHSGFYQYYNNSKYFHGIFYRKPRHGVLRFCFQYCHHILAHHSSFRTSLVPVVMFLQAPVFVFLLHNVRLTRNMHRSIMMAPTKSADNGRTSAASTKTSAYERTFSAVSQVQLANKP